MLSKLKILIKVESGIRLSGISYCAVVVSKKIDERRGLDGTEKGQIERKMGINGNEKTSIGETIGLPEHLFTVRYTIMEG